MSCGTKISRSRRAKRHAEGARRARHSRARKLRTPSRMVVITSGTLLRTTARISADLGQPQPDVEHDGDDDGRQVEPDHDPAREQPVGPAHAAEGDADGGADGHGDDEGGGSARNRVLPRSASSLPWSVRSHISTATATGVGNSRPGKTIASTCQMASRSGSDRTSRPRSRRFCLCRLGGRPARRRVVYLRYPFQNVPSAQRGHVADDVGTAILGHQRKALLGGVDVVGIIAPDDAGAIVVAKLGEQRIVVLDVHHRRGSCPRPRRR